MFGSIAPYDLLNHLLSLNIDKPGAEVERLVWCHLKRLAQFSICCTGIGDLALAYHKVTQGKT